MIEEKVNEEFKNVVSSIKSEIKTTQINTIQQVNKNIIMMYFRIGKILNDNSKYGNSFIENVARAIKLEYPNIKGFSNRNLKYMKKFYIEYKDYRKMQQLVAHLPWGHNILLMEKIKDNEIYFNGQIFDAYSKIHEIFKSTNNSLIIIDAYADNNTLRYW